MLKTTKRPIKHLFTWLIAMLLIHLFQPLPVMTASALADEPETHADTVVFSFGGGGNGQLGHGGTGNELTPRKIGDLSGIQAIAAGTLHSLVLTESGEVYSFGRGLTGQLGHGNTGNELAPKKIEGLSGIKAIAAGAYHSLVLTELGEVYSFGQGSFGQLGHGDTENALIPKKIEGLPDIQAIAAGAYHSLVLTELGEVYSFGQGSYGRLGHGEDTANQLSPKKIEGLSGIQAIAAGGIHSLILTDSEEVYSFGSGSLGRLGHGEDTVDQLSPKKIEGLSGIQAIAAGGTHSLALTKSGEVYSFGEDSFGRLGHGEDTADQLSPKKIEGLPDIQAIAAGWSHSLVLTESGEVYSFGSGGSGQLGHGNTSNRTVPTKIKDLSGIQAISAGGEHSLVLSRPEQVAKPIADPSGSAVLSGIKVTVSTLTEDATIYYTTDGSEPTSSSYEYTAPIEVTTEMTIKAVAVKDGMLDSEVMEEHYTILLPEQVAQPAADPTGGSVPSGTKVTLSTSTEGASIHFTMDGSEPTSSSAEYTAPIEVTAEMTIKVIAVKDGMLDSEVMEEHYTILIPEQVAVPTANPAGGAVLSGTLVALATTTEGATIYYTTDGSDPTGSSTEYTAPIEVTAEMTIQAIALKDGMLDSEVMEEHYTILIPEQVAVPTANPAGGAVLSGTLVALATTTEGATIHFTTDGTTPTSNSAEYTAPIEVTTEMTIQAIALKDGMLDSGVMKEHYTILLPAQVAQPAADPTGGAIPSGTKVTLSTTTEGAMIHYTTDGSEPTSSGAEYKAPIEVTTEMTIQAIAVKDGMLDSGVMDEHYTILLPEQVVMPAANPSGSVISSGTKVTLSTSTEGATIYYTTDGGEPTSSSAEYTAPIEVTTEMTIKAVAVKDEMLDSKVMEEHYTILIPEQVAVPTANPAGGAVMSGTIVALATTTEGATIYYTTDGSDPTGSSTEYTAPIEVTAEMTIKAVAVKSGMLDSEVMEEHYTILIPEQAVKPAANPIGGTVPLGTKVTLNTATEGASIHFTTDGSEPTGSSAEYTAPIEVSAEMTIQAIAVKNGMLESEVMEERYTILIPEQVVKPTADPTGGSVPSGTKVTLSTTTEGATIYYTTDGGEPTSSSAEYSQPIEVTTEMIIQAIAVKNGMLDSEVMDEHYTILIPEQVAMPVASPAGGAVSSGTLVALATTTEGATIYYTTDGSEPTSSSAEYMAPIEVTSEMMIQAIAVKDGMLDSGVMKEHYTILIPEQVAQPAADPIGGSVPSGTKVTLSTTTEGATIYYTIDGTTPTSSSAEYTAPIEVTAEMTIQAIAVKDGMLDSGVMKEHYTIAMITAPANLTALAGDRSVTLKWDGSTETGSVTYAVYQAEDPSDPVDPANWKLAQSNVTVNSYIVKGLSNEKTYAFAVKAFSTEGVSDFSNVAIAVPKAAEENSGSDGGYVGRSLSNNADLVDLQVWAGGEPLKLSPAFDSSTIEYTARTEVEQVQLVVKESHSAAKVILDGKVMSDRIEADLEEGKNTFVLTVQAENGTKKNYTLTIYREMPAQTKPMIEFTDIAGHWAESSIKRAVMKGMVSGYPDDTFKPNNPVTRAEFTVMMVDALKLDGIGADLPFKDQDKIGAWVERAVALAVQAGIVNGYDDGSFRPDARITRAEMAMMIAKALGLTLDENVTTAFADDEDIPNWAKGAVEAIRKLDIVSGRGGNNFVPNDTVTRAEAVVMMLRMLGVQD